MSSPTAGTLPSPRFLHHDDIVTSPTHQMMTYVASPVKLIPYQSDASLLQPAEHAIGDDEQPLPVVHQHPGVVQHVANEEGFVVQEHTQEDTGPVYMLQPPDQTEIHDGSQHVQPVGYVFDHPPEELQGDDTGPVSQQHMYAHLHHQPEVHPLDPNRPQTGLDVLYQAANGGLVQGYDLNQDSGGQQQHPHDVGLYAFGPNEYGGADDDADEENVEQQEIHSRGKRNHTRRVYDDEDPDFEPKSKRSRTAGTARNSADAGAAPGGSGQRGSGSGGVGAGKDGCRNHTGYIGVRRRQWGMFAAEIRDGDKRRWLGSFPEAAQAGMAYDAALILQKKHRAKTNFRYEDFETMPRLNAEFGGKVRYYLIPKDIMELYKQQYREVLEIMGESGMVGLEAQPAPLRDMITGKDSVASEPPSPTAAETDVPGGKAGSKGRKASSAVPGRESAAATKPVRMTKNRKAITSTAAMVAEAQMQLMKHSKNQRRQISQEQEDVDEEDPYADLRSGPGNVSDASGHAHDEAAMQPAQPVAGGRKRQVVGYFDVEQGEPVAHLAELYPPPGMMMVPAPVQYMPYGAMPYAHMSPPPDEDDAENGEGEPMDQYPAIMAGPYGMHGYQLVGMPYAAHPMHTGMPVAYAYPAPMYSEPIEDDESEEEDVVPFAAMPGAPMYVYNPGPAGHMPMPVAVPAPAGPWMPAPVQPVTHQALRKAGESGSLEQPGSARALIQQPMHPYVGMPNMVMMPASPPGSARAVHHKQVAPSKGANAAASSGAAAEGSQSRAAAENSDQAVRSPTRGIPHKSSSRSVIDSPQQGSEQHVDDVPRMAKPLDLSQQPQTTYFHGSIDEHLYEFDGGSPHVVHMVHAPGVYPADAGQPVHMYGAPMPAGAPKHAQHAMMYPEQPVMYASHPSAYAHGPAVYAPVQPGTARQGAWTPVDQDAFHPDALMAVNSPRQVMQAAKGAAVMTAQPRAVQRAMAAQ